MKGRGVLGLAALCTLLMASSFAAQAQAKSLKDQLAGTWTLVSQADIKKDGTKVAHFGANPVGLLIFDKKGHFSLMLVRADRPKFAGKSVGAGTADEYKAVMQGMVAQFGTYSVSDADKSFTTHVEGSWFPNLVGGNQKRTIGKLTADELTYQNATAATGESVEVVWKRAQ